MHFGAKQAKCLLGSAGKGQRPVRRPLSTPARGSNYTRSTLDPPVPSRSFLEASPLLGAATRQTHGPAQSQPPANGFERGRSPAPAVLAQGLHPATSLQPPVAGGTPCALGVPLRSPDFSLLPPVAESFLPPPVNPLALMLPE